MLNLNSAPRSPNNSEASAAGEALEVAELLPEERTSGD